MVFSWYNFIFVHLVEAIIEKCQMSILQFETTTIYTNLIYTYKNSIKYKCTFAAIKYSKQRKTGGIKGGKQIEQQTSSSN